MADPALTVRKSKLRCPWACACFGLCESMAWPSSSRRQSRRACSCPSLWCYPPPPPSIPALPPRVRPPASSLVLLFTSVANAYVRADINCVPVLRILASLSPLTKLSCVSRQATGSICTSEDLPHSADAASLPAQAMAGSSGISTTSLARGRGGGLSWRGATPDVRSDVVLQEKALLRVVVPKVPLVKVRPECSG